MERYKFDENQIITDFGKFQGELFYVPMLWDWIVDGHGTDPEGHPGGDTFAITGLFVDDIIEASPDEHSETIQTLLEPHIGSYATLTEDDNGFVHCTFSKPGPPKPIIGEQGKHLERYLKTNKPPQVASGCRYLDGPPNLDPKI